MHPYKVKMLKNIIGERTLTKFAEQAGISAGNLSRITKGQNASLETLRRMADASQGVISYDRLVNLFGFKGNEPITPEQLKNLIDFFNAEQQINERFLPVLSYNLGISMLILNSWFSETFYPTIEDVHCIADYLGVSFDFITGEHTSRKIKESPILSNKQIPILGLVHSGTSIMADENIERYLDLGVELHADYALTVDGDALSWVGIYHGDIALISVNTVPRHGDIVAVGHGNGNWSPTLMYYMQTEHGQLLQSGNPNYHDVPQGNDWIIVGTVTQIIKRVPGFDNYTRLLKSVQTRSSAWDSVVETALEYGLDAESVKGFIAAMHLMIKATKK